MTKVQLSMRRASFEYLVRRMKKKIREALHILKVERDRIARAEKCIAKVDAELRRRKKAATGVGYGVVKCKKPTIK